MPHKILLVDDDNAFRAMIRRYLEKHGFTVIDTDNGSTALLLARESLPDAILTDSEMPGLDGHTLCKVLRQESALKSIPVLLMSGVLVEDKNVLAGMESGADNYLLKPFSLPVMVAKIEAVLRRFSKEYVSAMNPMKCGLELDPIGRVVKVDGQTAALTRKEFDLLSLLVSKAGRVLTPSYLLETVWGYDLSEYNDTGTVDVHISHLRKKLGEKVATHIINMKSVGYKFED